MDNISSQFHETSPNLPVITDFCALLRRKQVFIPILRIWAGDDGELNEDPESDAFYRKYFGEWDAMSYNVFLYDLCTVLEEAVSGKITWDAVEGVIDGDIGDTMIDFFETVYKNDSGGYGSCDLDRRNKEIYNTKTFARVIDLLQQDMRVRPNLQGRIRKTFLEPCKDIK